MSVDVVEKEEKVFEFYEVLPPEIRSTVINQMQPDDKCKFAQCSKKSNVEAKVSRKYVYSLEFHGYTKDDLQIEVLHGEYEHYHDRCHGFYWQFKKEDEKKYMECVNLEEKVVWRKDLDESTDLAELAAQHFKEFLNKYQKIIKKLFLHDFFKVLEEGREKEFDLGLQTLSNVRELKIFDTAGCEQIMSKLRRPLKFLEVIGAANSQFLSASKHLYRVSDILLASECKLTYEQFKDLSADRMEIHMGDLTEENIVHFIKSWQNGTLESPRYYRWELKNSGFSIIKLFQLLDSTYDGSATKTLTIKHLKETGKKAELYFNNNGAIVDKKYLSFNEFEPIVNKKK